jgi:hypothetical protein
MLPLKALLTVVELPLVAPAPKMAVSIELGGPEGDQLEGVDQFVSVPLPAVQRNDVAFAV